MLLLSAGQWGLLYYSQLNIATQHPFVPLTVTPHSTSGITSVCPHCASTHPSVRSSLPFQVKAEWAPQLGECDVTGASPAVLNALYMYSPSVFARQTPLSDECPAAMTFDFVILVVTVAGLRFMIPGGRGGRGGRGGLWQMLFADGIAYFTLVASVNAIPAVCYVLTFFCPLIFGVLNCCTSVPRSGTQCFGSQWYASALLPQHVTTLTHPQQR